jgi:tRNA-Thr(GGU) m(6)t(6)A37 methyltransferase TsaA
MAMIATIVGHVRKKEGESPYIEIKEEYWEATLNLDLYSHIIVLWWITDRDNSEDRANLKGKPPVEDSEESGVFATRSPRRPTPIGHTICSISKIDQSKSRIVVDHMDAFDSTPVIDIKPYLPSSDRVDNPRFPNWFEENVYRYSNPE